MAWESPLDRLLLRQIHQAERGEGKPADVREQVLDLLAISGRRPQSLFHAGYAGVLLGLEWPEEVMDLAERSGARRWFLFGKLRAHDRRGEKAWISDLCEDETVLPELLREPAMAAQCLPLIFRTFFWNGDLARAVAALDLLASQAAAEGGVQDGAPDLLEAALNDLIARIEHRDEEGEDMASREILVRCMAMPGFDRLPAPVRARYHRAVARLHLSAGEWRETEEQVEAALAVAPVLDRTTSSTLLLAALARLRVPRLQDLAPEPRRPERQAAEDYLRRACADEERGAPEAFLARGVRRYEGRDFSGAAGDFDRAVRHFRGAPRQEPLLLARSRFYLGASLLAEGIRDEARRAARLIEQSLDVVVPDLETFYNVHHALKEVDRRVALRFLDCVDVGRGTAPEQILMVALEYQALGEAEKAEQAALRVLSLATDLDQRVEALKVLLTARNMRGAEDEARETYVQIRELYLKRGMFEELEALLRNEALVGQALDHVAIKSELIDLYEEMDGRESERAALQLAVARSLRVQREVDQLRQALLILQDVHLRFPELAAEDIEEVQRMLASMGEQAPSAPDALGRLADGSSAEAQAVQRAREALGRAPRVLVVGGNERQRRHHPKFEVLCGEWGLEGEWLMANYTSPQRLVAHVAERLAEGLDLLVLLHWNRHETTQPALDLARRHGVPARTVYYAGFTSLRVVLAEMLQRLASPQKAGKGAS